jgi:hemoglobin
VTTFYDEIGGYPTIEKIVATFYAGVAGDPVLRAVYPEEDLGPAEERFRLFLVQYWGGPTTYSDERGHPRLRLRHLPFHIGREERDRWLEHMSRAVDEATASLPDPAVREPVAQALLGYFHPTAEQMRNDTGLPITQSGQDSLRRPLSG